MNSHNLREKVGQMMIFGFHGITASDEIKELIRNHHIGGIILFSRNIGTPEEILSLTSELQREARKAGHKKPLLICIDEENGIVRRLGESATVFPGAMLLGATNNPDNAYKIGQATAKELKALGINWNLAPVVDVNNNPLNPVIGVRSYGESPDDVSRFGQAAMRGMQEAGVIAALKHFPGHGDTDIDSHLDLPVISHDMERLEQVELKPFVDCIRHGAATIMSAHVYFPAIEKRPNVPATLSRDVITGLLREKLQFKGVVTTDCMEMNAIAGTIGTAQGAKEAVKAGVDLVMVSHTYEFQKASIEAVIHAVNTGEISLQIIDDAVERIHTLKNQYLSWNDIPQEEGGVPVPSVVGCEDHQKLAEEMYRQGISIIKNDSHTIPLSSAAEHRVLVVYPKNSVTVLVEDGKRSNHTLDRIFKEIHPAAETIVLNSPTTKEETAAIIEKAQGFDTIIAGTYKLTPRDMQIELINQLQHAGKKVVVIAMRNPYDLSYFPNADASVAAYEFTYPALKMAVKAIYGLEKVTGRAPVTIPTA